ncbi:MAG: hypothetical protein EOM59_02775 [Clostridia bacterium]|nr:hypothetical protein [Clostridia bacterium]
MPDYRKYELSLKEKKIYYIYCSLALACLGFLFYKSLVIAVLCTFVSRPLQKKYENQKAKKRREELLEGFRDTLYSLSGSIASGRQMPVAIADAKRQALNSYGENAHITKELGLIVRSYEETHSSVEDLLTDFAERSGLEEIKQFGLVYRICKRSGGDLEEVTLKCASLLLDRISFQGEVNMLTAQKKLDILFLVSLPLLVLFFLNLVSANYISILYSCFSGRIIMTTCFFTIILALLWSLQLTEVQI